MKKIALLGAMALALGFTACDDYEEPNPPAQNNPQESILSTDEVAVKTTMEGVYNLAELNGADTDIKMMNIECTTLPATYEFVSYVEIGTGDKYFEVPSTVANDEEGVYSVTVDPDDLEGVYRANISKDPAQKTINVRMRLATKIGNQIAFVGGPAYYYGPFEAQIIPYTPDYVVEDTYYLISSADNWDVAKAIKMTNSGISPYDDPVFSAAIESTGTYEWKVIPASSFAAGNDNNSYGVEDATLMEGKLVAGGNAGVINGASFYLVTVNMHELTYSVTEAAPFLYTPGASNGWNQAASQVLYTNDYQNYMGYAYLAGEFKFTNAPDWNHTNYGSNGNEGELSNDSGAGNLMSPANGLFWCKVNTPALTYSLTLINTIGLIGDATPDGWNASTPLTPSADFLVWEGDVKFAGSGKFKFRANDAWDVNLGGDLQNLQQDGSDMDTPGEGTYHVVLNLSAVPYSATLTKK